MRAILESPGEPEAYLRLAHSYHEKGDPAAALHYARAAAECDPKAQSHASEPGAYGAYPCWIAAKAAAALGFVDEAANHARAALARDPKVQELKPLAEAGAIFDRPGPRPF